MMYINLRGIARYDGTNFAGWQIQPDKRTIQGELERCLSIIAGEKIRVYGASRTDAGVHALNQVFSFHWPSIKPFQHLPRALSAMLSGEIQISHIEEVPETFHARFDVKRKRYAYSFITRKNKDPFLNRYAWQIPWVLNLELINHLTPQLIGTHDFAGFQSSGSPRANTLRTLYAVELKQGCVFTTIDTLDSWRIEFEGDGFLYKMIRNIVGTLIEIARGKLSAEHLMTKLQHKGPYQGFTAPAHGLTLIGVTY